jgi:secreted effector protein SseD
MKTNLCVLVLCALVAGCSQTGQEQTSATAKPAAARQAKAAEGRCSEAIRASAEARQNTAMAGTILSAAGGLGGFAGRGGAIIGQAAWVGGSVMQAQARASAQDAIHRECR